MDNIVDMTIPRRFNLGKVIFDTETVLNAAMEIIERHHDDPTIFNKVIEYLKVYGICTRKLSNGITVVYWEDDERVDPILEASLAELPEYLTSEAFEVRLLATHRLEELNK